MSAINQLLKRVVAPHIWDIKPYQSARDEFKGEASIYLDANESPFPALWNRYPDPYQRQLKSALSIYKKVGENEMLITNGSDEGIDLLLRLFCVPAKDAIIICPPTYGMYAVSASIQNIETIEVPLTPDFQLDLSSVKASITRKTKLIFLCSPNNPTGNLLNIDDVKDLIESFKGIVVIDEAYIEFSNQQSLSSWLDKYNNLIVLHTLSKAWGLAGARIGICMAHPEIIALLNAIKPPYNLSGPAQEVALKKILASEEFELQTQDIIEQRVVLAKTLNEIDSIQKVFPSKANFLLVKVNDPDELYNYLTSQGIIIRNRSKQPGCEGCVRVTVGTTEENQQLIDEIIKYYEPK